MILQKPHPLPVVLLIIYALLGDASSRLSTRQTSGVCRDTSTNTTYTPINPAPKPAPNVDPNNLTNDPKGVYINNK